MNRLLLLLLLSCLTLPSAAQVPDFVTVRKRNGRTVKHIMTGLPATLQLKNGDYLQGMVTAIRNDSLFIQSLIERRYMSNFGVPMTQTLGSVVRPVHYLHIDRVQLTKRYSFWRRQGPPLLFIGGAGYVLLNTVNGALYGESVGDKANMRRLGTAASIAMAGLLLRKLFPVHGYSSRRHRVLYVNMQ